MRPVPQGCTPSRNSCHVVSRCFDISAQAGRLIALQRTVCVRTSTLAHLVYRVCRVLVSESAAVGACCRLARGGRRLICVMQSVTNSRTVRWRRRRSSLSDLDPPPRAADTPRHRNESSELKTVVTGIFARITWLHHWHRQVIDR